MFIAGSGADAVIAGAGSATPYGDSGTDAFHGGLGGHDVIVAGSGNTSRFGGDADLMFGNASSEFQLVATAPVGGGASVLTL